MSKYDTVVVNLFGGPGIGKTTTANSLVGNLKRSDIDAVYISEYIKELIYKANSGRVSLADKEIAKKLLDGSLYSQSCVFSRQKEMLDIHVDQVPVVVTDSPLPLNTIYLKDKSEPYCRDVMRCFNDEYVNLNIVLERDPNALFQTEGRIHDKNESVVKDREIVKFLRDNNINYVSFPVNDLESMLKYIKAAIQQSKGISITSSEIFDDSELDPSSVYIENDSSEKCIVLTDIGDDEDNHRITVRKIPYDEVLKGFYKARANYEGFFDYIQERYDPEYVTRGTDAWNDRVDSICEKVRNKKLSVADKGSDAAKTVVSMISRIKEEVR